jgi:S-adenosylmethionine hydrolase
MFAPVAAHIAKGVPLLRIGSHIDEADLVRLADLGCFHSDNGELMGKIVSIDRFGNVISDIDSDHLREYCGTKSHREPQFQIGNHLICGLSDTYESAESQTLLALIGSRGYLEIAVNSGSAEKRLNVQKGDRVKVVI